LAKALDRPSLRLLRSTVRALAIGDPLDEVPQDDALATDAPFLDDEAAAVTWSHTSEAIVRQVRALAPTPGAWTEIARPAVTLLRVERVGRYPKVLAPGEGALVEGAAVIRTGDGALRLIEAEIDGEPAGPSELAALFA